MEARRNVSSTNNQCRKEDEVARITSLEQQIQDLIKYYLYCFFYTIIIYIVMHVLKFSKT